MRASTFLLCSLVLLVFFRYILKTEVVRGVVFVLELFDFWCMREGQEKRVTEWTLSGSEKKNETWS